MKIKFLLACVVMATLSTNASALQIHKGKLLSHKEWSTGKAKLSLAKAIIAKRSLKDNTDGTWSSLTSEIHPATGLVNQMIAIKNEANIYLQNNSDHEQTYELRFSICAMPAKDSYDCVDTWDTIQLQPGGHFSDPDALVLNIAFDQPGEYTIFSDSSMWTEYWANSAYSSSESSVIVS